MSWRCLKLVLGLPWVGRVVDPPSVVDGNPLDPHERMRSLDDSFNLIYTAADAIERLKYVNKKKPCARGLFQAQLQETSEWFV